MHHCNEKIRQVPQCRTISFLRGGRYKNADDRADDRISWCTDNLTPDGIAWSTCETSIIALIEDTCRDTTNGADDAVAHRPWD